MSTTVSNTTSAVLANIAKTFSGSLGSCGDPIPIQAFNSVFTVNNASGPQGIATSGFIAPAASSPPVHYTITTTEALPNSVPSNGYYVFPEGWQQAQQNWSGDAVPNFGGSGITVPNDNTWYPNLGMPYIGDPMPNSGGGFVFPPQIPTPFKIEPKLEDLEEGLHDIPGGKIFIKKIKITEEQLDDAIQEALGHEASSEEKAQVIKELEELAASEEREV